MQGPRKAVETLHAHDEDRRLKPSLSWPHLVAMGVGAIVGTGIFTLIGVAAGLAGPAMILSFAIAGVVCACAALCYAEVSTALPASGSAYTYSYVTMGETIAWIIGWALVLEYSVACAAVATGWSGYAAGLLGQAGIDIPEVWLHGPGDGGILNVPAVFISLLVTALLVKGAKESATVNLGLVAIKMIALALFIGIAVFAFRPENLTPFMPFGFGNPLDFSTDAEGNRYGVAAAAAIIFFAFYGFDAVSTSAEEAKNPGRDLTIGILGSMALCTLLYMLVGAAAVGAWPWMDFAGSDWPLSEIMRNLNHPLVASLIAGAAIVALPSVILVMMYGQTRVFFVMSRDGLLPHSLSVVNRKTGVPTRMTLIIGAFIAVVSGLVELGDIASVANAGTLAAFIAVAASLMILRRTHPDLPRLFRCPAPNIVAPLAIVGCLYLFVSLKLMTIAVFFGWMALGLLIYIFYGRIHSHARARL